jgi:hypothetical protein
MRFRERLLSAMQNGDVHLNELQNFARHCINNEEVNCVTFNYDTLLDQESTQIPRHAGS